MKRKLLVLLCSLATIGVVSGCSSKSEDNWKKYCIAKDALDYSADYSEYEYNIIDLDNNGIPEVLSRVKVGDSYSIELRSFYDFVNEPTFVVSKPSPATIISSSDTDGSGIYIYNNNIVEVGYSPNGLLLEIFIRKDYPSTDNSLKIQRDRKPVTGDILDTFTCYGVYNDTVSGESGAIARASEFLGTDVMSLEEPEYPYTYEEHIEALRNY